MATRKPKRFWEGGSAVGDTEPITGLPVQALSAKGTPVVVNANAGPPAGVRPERDTTIRDAMAAGQQARAAQIAATSSAGPRARPSTLIRGDERTVTLPAQYKTVRSSPEELVAARKAAIAKYGDVPVEKTADGKFSTKTRAGLMNEAMNEARTKRELVRPERTMPRDEFKAHVAQVLGRSAPQGGMKKGGEVKAKGWGVARGARAAKMR